MGKLFAIGALVLGIWCAMEVYNNGPSGAFGGALARVGLADEAPEEDGVATSRERVRAAANRAHAEADARRERLLAE